MDAIILVGGKGTRLKSIINDRPKPMALVLGRPFLEWVLLSLKAKGLKKITLATGYLSNIVENHFKKGTDLELEIKYSKETSALGTGGAIRLALQQIKSDPFLVLNGDSYCTWNLNLLRETHTKKNALATIWLTRTSNSSRFGTVDIDERGNILAFKEKTPSENVCLINAGVYMFQRELFEKISLGESFSLERDLFPRMIGQRLYGVIGEGAFLDIGIPASYALAPEFLKLELNELQL